MPRTRWFHLAALTIIVAMAVTIRVQGLGRYGIWRDEYYALYLSTGRGETLFDIPYGKIIEHPPMMGFADAPAWWRVWGSTGSSFHPPLYHLMLRGWVDLFGERDGTIRILSTVFGVLGIIFLFDGVRILRGPGWGLLAAAMMTFSPLQMDYAQQARPYTLLALIAILIFSTLIAIEKQGANRLRLLLLAVLCAAAELTHYFSVGFVVGAGVYALLALQGATRRRTLFAIALGSLFAIAAWAPEFIHNRAALKQGLGFDTPATLLQATLEAPQRLVIGRMHQSIWPSAIALAFLVLVLPAFDRRKRIWWIYLTSTLAWVLIVDLARHSVLMDTDRYIFAAAPAAFAILATPGPTRLGWLIPPVACIAVISFGIARLQQGPDFTTDSIYQVEDHRLSAAYLEDKMRLGDLVVLTGGGMEPAFNYFVMGHYNGPWKTPVLLATDPLSDEVKRQMATYNRVWLSARYPTLDVERVLPEYSLIDLRATMYDGTGQLVAPKEIEAPSTRP